MKIVKYFLLLFLIILFARLKILTISPENTEIKVLKYLTTTLNIQKSINVYYYIPVGNKKDMSVQIILHGASRNADEYIEAWKEKANKYNLILIAPEFSKSDFTIGEYSQGMLTNEEGKLIAKEKNLFYLLDDVFKFVNNKINLEKQSYNLYGHSAGGQFVHRFLQFHDSPYVNKSIAANAGWYTFPDSTTIFPYGISDLGLQQNEIRKNYFKKDMFILLGTADTLRTNNFRVTKEADQQGLTRLERGNNYYISNKMTAAREGYQYNWKHGYVKDAGHDHIMMSHSSADILYLNL